MARLAKATETGPLPLEKVGPGSFCSYLEAVHRDEHKLAEMKLDHRTLCEWKGGSLSSSKPITSLCK